VSNFVGHVHGFDGDVARAKKELFRSRRSIATAKRELEAHEQWLHHHDLLWQKDLKQCQRGIKRQRAIRVRKHLAFSLILFVLRTCRALLHGAVRLLQGCGRGISISTSWFAERTRVKTQSRCVRKDYFVGWTRQATLGILGVAAVTLLTVGAVKPLGFGEVIVSIRPEIQSPVRLAAVAPEKILLSHPGTREPSPGVAPGFTLTMSVPIPEPPPLSGKDIVSMMLLTTPLALAPANAEVTQPAPAAPRSLAGKPKAKPRPELAAQMQQAELPSVRPKPTSRLATTPLALAPANAEVTQPAPAAPRSLAGKPKANPRRELAAQMQQAELPPLRPKPTSRLATQSVEGSREWRLDPRPRSGFVPHPSW